MWVARKLENILPGQQHFPVGRFSPTRLSPKFLELLWICLDFRESGWALSGEISGCRTYCSSCKPVWSSSSQLPHSWKTNSCRRFPHQGQTKPHLNHLSAKLVSSPLCWSYLWSSRESAQRRRGPEAGSFSLSVRSPLSSYIPLHPHRTGPYWRSWETWDQAPRKDPDRIFELVRRGLSTTFIIFSPELLAWGWCWPYQRKFPAVDWARVLLETPGHNLIDKKSIKDRQTTNVKSFRVQLQPGTESNCICPGKINY